MKRLSILKSTLVAAVLCAAAFAQQTITTTTATDNGGNVSITTTAVLTTTGQRAVLGISVYQGSSTLLKSQTFCYNNYAGNCLSQTVTFPITQETVTTIMGSVSSKSVLTFDQYGNTLTDSETDFTGTLLTLTINTFGTCGAGPNINNRPCEILVTDAGSHKVSDTTYAYNGRGEATNIGVWNGSSYLPIVNTFNANGTLATSIGIDGVISTYSYSGPGGCPSGASMFPTSVVTGTLASSTTYNCNGGVILTTTDPNGEVTTIGYTDPFWRISSAEDPLGNSSSSTYTATSAENVFTFGSSTHDVTNILDSLGRASATKVRQAPGGTTYDTTTTTYGWTSGERSVVTTPPAAGAYTALSDGLGRATSIVDALGRTVTTTYTDNDALVVLTPTPAEEHNKQVQTQVDAAGRPTITCAIQSSGGTICGQNSGSASGTVTSYTYPTGLSTTQTRGSQSRTTVFDPLGRVTSTTSPELGAITNTYDSGNIASACGSNWANGIVTLGNTPESGDLVLTNYANGAVTCYAPRDSSGRLTDEMSISSGGVKTCMRFRYDDSSGVTGMLPTGIGEPAFGLGRMIEAETDSCAAFPVIAGNLAYGGTMLTDEWFSYDKDGHVTSMWELTPDSGIYSTYTGGSYLNSTAQYFADGSLNSIGLQSPSNGTATWTEDGEGRPYSFAVSGSTVIASVAYNGASQPTTVALGTSTDEDTFNYGTTGNLTQWTYQVGAAKATQTGVLTWNPNGTLNKLAITDGFNSGGTQTCTFGTSTVAGYDDLGRLLSDNCGTKWTQTFAYDQYDNLTKTGTNGGVSWPPSGTTYSAANNRYTGNSAISYDASGNLLTDTFHRYSWGGGNQLASIDTVNIVRDAFGHPAEMQIGGVGQSSQGTMTSSGSALSGSGIAFSSFVNNGVSSTPTDTVTFTSPSIPNLQTGGSFGSGGTITIDVTGFFNYTGTFVSGTWTEHNPSSYYYVLTAYFSSAQGYGELTCTTETVDHTWTSPETLTSCTVTTFTSVDEIWYTPAGKTAFMNGSNLLYAYWMNGLVTSVAGGNYYQHKDWLGTTRISSNVTNQSWYADQAVAPYGEIYDQFGTGSPLSLTGVQSFTNHTQDIVAGTYDAPNRELNANQGRWIQPDPSQAGWNGYSYPTNPLITTDSTGLQPDGSGDDVDFEWTFTFQGGNGAGVDFQAVASGWATNPGNVFTDPGLLSWLISGPTGPETMPVSLIEAGFTRDQWATIQASGGQWANPNCCSQGEQQFLNTLVFSTTVASIELASPSSNGLAVEAASFSQQIAARAASAGVPRSLGAAAISDGFEDSIWRNWRIANNVEPGVPGPNNSTILEEHNAASDPIVKAIAVRNAAAATQNELVKQVSAAANALPGSVFQHDWANVAMLENMGSSKATSYRQMMVDYYVANKSQWPTDLASTPNVIQNEGRFMRNPVLGSHQLSSWGIPKP